MTADSKRWSRLPHHHGMGSAFGTANRNGGMLPWFMLFGMILQAVIEFEDAVLRECDEAHGMTCRWWRREAGLLSIGREIGNQSWHSEITALLFSNTIDMAEEARLLWLPDISTRKAASVSEMQRCFGLARCSFSLLAPSTLTAEFRLLSESAAEQSLFKRSGFCNIICSMNQKVGPSLTR
jgi:hypothetical protein